MADINNFGKEHLEDEEFTNKNSGNSGEKKNIFNIVIIMMIIIGAVIAMIGYALIRNTDTEKYFKTTTINETYDIDDINAFDIECGATDISILKSKDGKIHLGAEKIPEKSKVSVNGKTLSIVCEKNGDFDLSFWIFHWNGVNDKITIELPEKEYEKLAVSAGAGDMDLSGVSFGEIKLESGAGDIDLESVKCDTASVRSGAGDHKYTDFACSGTLTDKTGAGDTKAASAKLGGFNSSHGAGDTNFTGRIDGDIKVSSGAGDVTLNLENSSSDYIGKYKMDISTGAGSTKVTYDN